jgi:hypothetical protein
MAKPMRRPIRRPLACSAESGCRRYDRAVRVFPVGGFFLRLGQAALGFIAVLVALGSATIPSGPAKVAGIVTAVLILAGAAYLIRSMHRQAIVVDGNRLGWRRGLTSKIVGWTDLADVEGATKAKVSTTVTKDRKVDTILWTRRGGLQGFNAVLLRRQLPADLRRQLDDAAGSTEPLHPFIVPFSALSDEGRTVIGDLLATRGLLTG